MNRLEKIDLLLIIAFVAIIAFPILYVARSLDNNTLTSWQWIFRDRDMLELFLLLAAGVASSFFLSTLKPQERYYPVILFAVSFSAVLPLWNEPEVILDASRYFVQAKHLELYGIASFFREWGRGLGAWTDLPVVPFLYGLIFRYLGESRTAVQLFTTALFSLTVFSTYRIGTALWNREAGFLAGLLLLGFPFLLTQVPLMLVDVPAMFFVTLSMDAFLGAVVKGGRSRILFASVAIVFTLFTKYSTWFMLPVLPVVALVAWRGGSRTVLWRGAAILSIAGLLAAAAFLAGHAVFLRQLDLLRAYQWPGLTRCSETKPIGRPQKRTWHFCKPSSGTPRPRPFITAGETENVTTSNCWMLMPNCWPGLSSCMKQHSTPNTSHSPWPWPRAGSIPFRAPPGSC